MTLKPPAFPIALALALVLAPLGVSAQRAPVPLPQEVGAEAAWAAFKARPMTEELGAQFERLANLLDENGEVGDEVCLSNTLRELEAEIPVSIALWWMQSDCAERLGDAAAAERSLEGFASLARYALENAPDRNSGAAPTPIASELDLWFLLRGLEMELGYVYIDTLSGGPYSPFQVSLWDPLEKREHLLSLDFIDILMQMVGAAGELRSPSTRIALRTTYLQSSAEFSAALPSAQALRLVDAIRAPEKERSARLSALAGEGDFHAAERLFRICAIVRRTGCGTQLVDALLPYAEAGIAEATTMLGTVQALGLGVRRDARAAERLYARADERLGDFGSSLAAARLWLQPPAFGELPKPLAERIERAAREGYAEAHDLLLLNAIAEEIRRGASPRRLRKLEHADRSDSAWVRTGYGMALLESDPDAGLVHLIEGARRGGFGNVNALLVAMSRTGKQPLDEAELMSFHSTAGYGGRTDSALWVGRHYRKQNRTLEARSWLIGAAQLGSSDGAYEAAELLVDTWPGDDSLASAAALLEALLERGPRADAERLLADLLIQGVGGVQADRPRAAKLLRALHARGDAQASSLLASNLLLGTLEAEAGENPRQMLEAIAAKGGSQAMAALAQFIYTGDIPGEAADAWAWWRKAIEAGDPSARNNLAWTQCVSADPRFRKVDEGLAEANRMGDPAALPTAYRDTVATCFAANGDFDRAIELEQSILDELQAAGAPEAGLGYFRDKLALFQRGEVFLEERAHFGGAAPESDAAPEASAASESR
ncbi:hypothetical protein SAMN04488509_12317 [Aquimonas voraii]|uniref:TPR repeat n=2 Tax=Aquimonas voraii TaxID=265719 RepID=A0A1G7ADN6_9GAMM|nr:hypothetical protein SAMN04488509_12317 [Aquimonas voraii]